MSLTISNNQNLKISQEQRRQAKEDAMLSSHQLDPILVNRTLQQKCALHPSEFCDLVYLNHAAQNIRICNICQQELNIPPRETLTIRQLLNTNFHSYYIHYQMFTDAQTSADIKGIIGSVDAMKAQVDRFFEELQGSINRVIQTEKQKADAQLRELKESYDTLLDQYKRTARIEEFQQLLVNSSNNNNRGKNKLQGFLEEQNRNQAAYSALINSNLENFKRLQSQFSLEQPQQIYSEIINLLNTVFIFSSQEPAMAPNVNPNNPAEVFFNTQPMMIPSGRSSPMPHHISHSSSQLSQKLNQIIHTQSLSLANIHNKHNTSLGSSTIRSTYFTNVNFLRQLRLIVSKNIKFSSTNLRISKSEDGKVTLINNETSLKWVQAYFKSQLNPAWKYIIRLKLVNDNESCQPCFQFGLHEHTKLDNTFIDYQTRYCEIEGLGNVNKILRGDQLHSSYSAKGIGEKTLEIRIDIQNKVFKVANYPSFQNVAEISDSSLIQDGKIYHFAMSISGQTNKIVILDVMTVNNFDNKV